MPTLRALSLRALALSEGGADAGDVAGPASAVPEVDLLGEPLTPVSEEHDKVRSCS